MATIEPGVTVGVTNEDGRWWVILTNGSCWSWMGAAKAHLIADQLRLCAERVEPSGGEPEPVAIESAQHARHTLAPSDPVHRLLAAEQEAWAAFIAADAGDAATSNALGKKAVDALATLLKAEAPSPAALAAMIDTYVARNGDDFCGDDRVMRMLTLAVGILAPGSAAPAWRDPVT